MMPKESMAGLNMSPIRPLNNLSGGSPASGGFGGGVPLTGSRGVKLTNNLASSRTKDAFGHLDVERIGKGYLMTEGSYQKRFGEDKYAGLKGQLMGLRAAGKHSTTKNLSQENVKQMHDLIAEHLGKKSVSSQNFISRQDKLAILKESRKLVKTEGSHFTWDDREDLEKTVNTLQKQYRDQILNKGRGEAASPVGTPEPPTGIFKPQNSGPNTGLTKLF